MPELPRGRIGHLSAGRLRIRIPEKRRDQTFFGTVATRLSGWDSIDRVEVNPLTASILVHFPDQEALFAEMERRNDLFTLAAEPAESGDARQRVLLSDRVTRLWKEGDKALRRWSAGSTDLRSAAFAVLVVTAGYQVLRGQIFPPAGTLLWDAGQMLKIWQAALDEPQSGGNEKAAVGD